VPRRLSETLSQGIPGDGEPVTAGEAWPTVYIFLLLQFFEYPGTAQDNGA
jgi:hypothetical protein